MMKRCSWVLGWLAFLLSATACLAESEYDTRARRIAEYLSNDYRPLPTGDAPAEAPESKELVYPDSARAATPGDFHFAIGTRILYVALLNDTQGRSFQNSFIGSLYKIEADQDYLPLRPYAQVTMRTGPVEIGLGLSYDRLEIATRDNGGGDGKIDMESWMAYLLAAWPNETRFTPFGEFGLAAFQNSFDPIASWSDGGKREFNLDNSLTFYVAAGCDIAINRQLFANLYLRYVDVDVDGEYVYRPDGRAPRPFTFTVEHLACGVGLKYVF